MMPINPRVLWQTPEAREFLWRDLNGVSALYDRRSGDTHLLDGLAHEIFDILAERPRSLAETADALAANLERTPDDELQRRVAEAIAEFDRLGLVFPLAEPPQGR